MNEQRKDHTFIKWQEKKIGKKKSFGDIRTLSCKIIFSCKWSVFI